MSSSPATAAGERVRLGDKLDSPGACWVAAERRIPDIGVQTWTVGVIAIRAGTWAVAPEDGASGSGPARGGSFAEGLAYVERHLNDE